MEIIKAWLKNPDYWHGVELFEKLGRNEFYKSLFRSAKTFFNEQKLREELEALIIQNEEISNSKKETTEDEKPQEYSKQNSDNLFLIKKRHHLIKQIYRSIDNNRFQLLHAKSDKTRKEYAFQILSLHFKKSKLFDEIVHIQEYGSLPSQKEIKDFITPEIQRLYVQIYKAKKRLDQKPERIRNKAKTENLLAEKENRLKMLLEERTSL